MSDRALRWALRLHPVGYRREWGDEIAAVFADTTADSGRWGTARELFDLAGHGVRLRLGLGSGGVLARLAAMVAPFAATAAAGQSLVDLYFTVRIRWGGGHLWNPLLPTRFEWVPFLSAGLSELLFLVVAVAAVRGRWTAARLLGPLGLAAGIYATTAYLFRDPLPGAFSWMHEFFFMAFWFSPQALWLLILLAAPRDLLGPPTRRRSLAALAGVLIGGMLWSQVFRGTPLFRSVPQWVNGTSVGLLCCGVELALLLIAAPALLRGRLGPAAWALAGSPICLLVVVGLVNRLRHVSGAGAGLFVIVVGLAVVAVCRWRPVIPERRPPAAG